ncbi:MAG: hypothetical protein GPOALKHO_000438 [Sodalis sp.]|nr:MAG: hypothetical protein GPOALKHO_000438 [Sodalis sp.]
MNNYKIPLMDDHELIIHGTINLLEPYPRFKSVAHIDPMPDPRSGYSSEAGVYIVVIDAVIAIHFLKILIDKDRQLALVFTSASLSRIDLNIFSCCSVTYHRRRWNLECRISVLIFCAIICLCW